MRLELTLVAGPSAAPRDPVEITVDVPCGAPGSAVRDALALLPGALAAPPAAGAGPDAPATVAGLPLESLRAGTPPLANGAVVVAGGAPPGEREPPPLVLAVHTGPDAGRLFGLHRGDYTVGRGRVDLPLADPALARHHASLHVAPDGVLLSANGPRNSFTVDGVRATRAAVATGQSLLLGGSGCQLLIPPRPRPPAPDGVEEPLLIQHSPAGASGRWTAAAMAAVPLGAGVLLAVLTGQWMFLAFSAAAAASAMVPLLGGGRRRRAFAARVAEAGRADAARRLARWPSAAEMLLDPTPWPQPGGGPPPPLRLGTCRQDAHVALNPPEDRFSPPSIAGLPLTTGIPPAGLELLGPVAAVRSLARFVLMQLDAAGVDTVVCASVAGLELAARFLPTVRLAGTAAALAAALADRPPAALVVLDPAGHHAVAKLAGGLRTAGQVGPAMVRCHPPDPAAGAATVALGVSGAVLAHGGSTVDFAPDLVSGDVFDSYARARGAMAAPERTAGTLPAHCTLPDRDTMDPESVAQRWAAAADGPLSAVPLGSDAGGIECLDLEADGPHLLVAGTTGSGKSELLRTLGASLALAHSPADLSFLFLDFKGGAGLEPLHRFPHASALATDMAGTGMARTMASLQAEIRRRESVLAAAGEADLAAYRRRRTAGAARLPHLVVVIDEFRVLVDQFPDAMKELMRIAAVGRSLGIHLVMATQRPQGAVSADIRANVSTAICLRVQSAFDSQDVLGSGIAASIPAALPGRAYIRRQAGEPTAFQTAEPAGPGGAATATAALAAELLARPPAPAGATAPGNEGIEALVALLRATHALARTPVPDPVVAAELPRDLAPGSGGRPAGCGRGGAGAGYGGGGASGDGGDGAWSRDGGAAGRGRGGAGASAVLGLLDAPSAQRVLELGWRPGTDGHLALVGQPGSGCASALAGTARALLAQGDAGPGGGAALYCLDGDGSLSGLRGHPRVGGHIDATDPRTAARLLRRLAETAGSGTAPDGELLLCISSWGRWAAVLRSSPWPWAEDLVAELCGGGQARPVVLLASGGRELVAARFMAAIPNRLFFPHGASAEAVASWPRLPEVGPVPGRAVAFGPLAAAAGSMGAGHIVQLVHWGRPGGVFAAVPVGEPGPAQSPGRAAPALRVAALPAAVGVEQILAAARLAGRRPGGHRELLLGLGGDGGDPVGLPVEPGMLVPVLGAAGTGKTSLLESVLRLNPSLGIGAVLWPGGTEPAGGQAPVAVVDDLDRASPAGVARVQALLDGGTMVLASARPDPGTLLRLPLPGLRTPRAGIVLAPRRPQDGEFLGVRLDAIPGDPPGRAVLVCAGAAEWFQAPLPAHAPRTGRSGGSRLRDRGTG
ncbi:FtsK/SpoIIIE domain-containing protein [Pseudarthrobacter sp. P1]|uniref:FtsK/SpoIIIE domain-containing protein n=1 Tax=Pseudarthrobacter sp. P1 TaxID=3418418 RepID=UPI003CF372BF